MNESGEKRSKRRMTKPSNKLVNWLNYLTLKRVSK